MMQGTNIDPKAIATVMAGGDLGLGLFFIKDFKMRQASRDLLKSLKEAGFDLSTPSGVVLEGLLRSGAMSPDQALGVYVKLLSAQTSVIDMQNRLLDLKLRQAQINQLNALTLESLTRSKWKETESAGKLVESFFKPRLDAIEEEKKEIRATLNTMLSQTGGAIGRLDPEAIGSYETRLKALDMAQQILSRQRLIASQRAEELMREGVNPLTATNLAIQHANAEVLEDFGAWVRDGVFKLPSSKDIMRGRAIGKELVNVMSSYVDPQYGALMDKFLKLNSGGVVPEDIEDKGEDEGLGFWGSLGIGGMAVAIGLGAKKLYEVLKGRRGQETELTGDGEGKVEGKKVRQKKVVHSASARRTIRGALAGRPIERPVLGAGEVMGEVGSRRRNYGSRVRMEGTKRPFALRSGIRELPASRVRGILPERIEAGGRMNYGSRIPLPAGKEAIPMGGYVEQLAEQVRRIHGLEDGAKALERELEKVVKQMEGVPERPQRMGLIGRMGRLGGVIGRRLPAIGALGMIINELQRPEPTEYDLDPRWQNPFDPMNP